MEIKILSDLYSDENTYFLINGKKAIVIDPGCPVEKIVDFSKDLEIEFIFLTHCHYDHISGVNELKKITGARVCCTAECSEHIKNPDISLTEMGLGKREIIEKTDIILSENEDFCFYENKIKIIKTPGHTSCSTCFLFEDNLFSGDTLFYQSIGRWDLPTGNYKEIEKSIKDIIYSMEDKINVYPGHGRKTSVGYEKKYNMFIK